VFQHIRPNGAEGSPGAGVLSSVQKISFAPPGRKTEKGPGPFFLGNLYTGETYSNTVNLGTYTTTPEPATLTLLATAMAGLLARQRRLGR
jgi:hypothetical protein